MPAFSHGPLLPGAAQTQSGGPQAYEGTATLAVGAATTANGLLGLFGEAALAVANAVTSGAEWFGADLPAWMWRVYQRVRRHPYTRM